MASSVERRNILLLTTLMKATVHVDVALLLIARKQRKRRLRRSIWTRKWILCRPLHDHYEQLMHELMKEDPDSFGSLVGLDVATFWEMVDRITPRMVRQDTLWRRSSFPTLRLAVKLRYLSTEDSYKSLSYDFRVAHNTISPIIISPIIPDICEAIYQESQAEVMWCPRAHAEGRAVAGQFDHRWQFPHALGSIDDKHIAVRCPTTLVQLVSGVYTDLHRVIPHWSLVVVDHSWLYSV